MSALREPLTSAPILSVGELVRELLRKTDPRDFGRILERYTFPSHDLLPYLRWNQKHYTRTCVVRNGRFELLVICYESGQRTSIHDYDSTSAWVQPLMGDVREERFQADPDGGIRLKQASRLTTGVPTALSSDNSIHRFTNGRVDHGEHLLAGQIAEHRPLEALHGYAECTLDDLQRRHIPATSKLEE